MECPRCSTALISTTYENTKMDSCSQCSGIWLDNANLQPILTMHDIQFSPAIIEQTLKLAHAGLQKAEVDALLPCPECLQNMHALNYDYNSGIIIHACPNGKGLWFDKDELAEVQIFMDHWDEEEQKNQDNYINLENNAKAEEEAELDKEDEDIRGKLGPISRIMDAIFHRFEVLQRKH